MSRPTAFWVISPPEATDKLADWDESVALDGPIQCPLNPAHQRAGRRLTDLSVVLPYSSVQDFVWTWNSECLIQDNVLGLLNAEKVTGFEAKPVEVRFQRAVDSSQVPPRLWEIVVTGWGGVAPTRSGVRLDRKASCSACGLLVYRNFTDASQLIDESQWDGSDIFMVWPLPKFIFVTARIAQLIQSNELTGVTLQRPEELRPSANIISPGRLSYRMPKDRATELGSHLGIA